MPPAAMNPLSIHEPNPAMTPDPFDDLIGPPTPAKLPTQGGIVPFAPADDFIRHYGLNENAFADCVSPTYFFRTDSHAEAFRNMMLAVDFKASLGMVTGPSGTGKTLVTQLLLQHFDDPRFKAVLVLVTPGLSKTGLLREILSELNLALPVGINRVQDLVKLLSNHIIELHQQGQRLVILIDECHLLSADCLHIVRTISNIETPQEKLVTCLLFGESRLAHRLTHPSYESLQNRIYLRSTLAPLTPEEAAQYVKFRLMTAGRLTEPFTPEALAAIHRHAHGVCRSMNKLAMLSMIEGSDRRVPVIDETIVETAARRM
jgi:type II secretory pathway predicted ATPase ExeA